MSGGRDADARRVGGGPLAIAPMTAADGAAVLAIYAAGIATGDATFQTEVPGWAEWDAAHLRTPRLVARDRTGDLVGWCALSAVSRRAGKKS